MDTRTAAHRAVRQKESYDPTTPATLTKTREVPLDAQGRERRVATFEKIEVRDGRAEVTR